jgi:thiamine pyrophosphate-dependent acetolactate synthase large subunit-like protein
MTGRPAITAESVRDVLAAWIIVLNEHPAKIEREYGAPMAWCGDLANDLSDVAALLRERQTVGVRCGWCGEPIERNRRGAPRKYCPRPRRCRDYAADAR